MKIVEFQDVAFGYNHSPFLKDVNFSINQKEFCCIVGPNGAGKTTLLKLILGLRRPWSGVIKVFGKDPVKTRGAIGYMPQHLNYDYQFPATVKDVVLMGRLKRSLLGRYDKEDYFAAEEAMRDMEILDFVNEPLSELSGGQRQRVLIARALACRPELLIFDEPTAGIDSLIESRLLKILKRLSERMAIVMVSHNLRFVADIVQKVICVDKRVAIHETSGVTKELIDQLHAGHFRAIVHDHCDHSKDDL